MKVALLIMMFLTASAWGLGFFMGASARRKDPEKKNWQDTLLNLPRGWFMAVIMGMVVLSPELARENYLEFFAPNAWLFLTVASTTIFLYVSYLTPPWFKRG